MTDIVKRLRGNPAYGDHASKLIAEAANELERFADELFLANQKASNYHTALFTFHENIYKPQMANAEAEIERLRRAAARGVPSQYEDD